MIGEQVQQYLVQRKLNEGAMGSIYLALDTTLDRPVALKFVLSDINNHPGMARRFLEEAKVLASLNRPNIPVLYGYFIWNDRGVIAMEYVDGESFESMILRRGPIPAAVCVPLVKQALTGLAFAHQRGIVHRDLKPGNLMINQEGNVFTGYQSGYSNTKGRGNAFAGYQAGYSNTTGSGNVFTGDQAGYSNTGGNYNVFTGVHAGYYNTDGVANVATGYEAGFVITTGNGNVFDGNGAGASNTTGSYNVFLGTLAGGSIVAGSSNIDIGYNSGSNGDESNTIRIGAAQTAAYFAGINGQSTNGGVPVYIDSTGKLGTLGGTPSVDNVSNGYEIGGNSVLSAGNYDANAYVGEQAGYANTQGAGNAFVGLQAGYNNNSNYNTFLGYQAGYNNTTGSSDIYLGNVGCPSPCTENNTIRIGNQGAGSNQQNTTYIAGINGSTVSNASPVYVDPNGQVGTSNARFQWVYYTYDAPANTYGYLTASCRAPYPYLVSGSCGANTWNSASYLIVVNYSGPDTGNGSSNNPSYQANPNTWQCNYTNNDLSSSHTILYGALCSN